MSNLTLKKESFIEASKGSCSIDYVAEVIDFLSFDKIIAKQEEKDCDIDGNLNSDDFDFFEQKYNITFFA